MTTDASLLHYFFQAGMIVKAVMILLALTSVFSWMYIFERRAYLKKVNQNAMVFEDAFWSGVDLSKLYMKENNRETPVVGLEKIFLAGYKEFMRFHKSTTAPLHLMIENTKRAMRAAEMREQDKLEKHLSFLAIVGSTSPYIGLFGTVWGIMQAFGALSNVQQATIAMVAPGIAEALIATALGLFTAIPAVIAYNRFLNGIQQMLNRFEAFQEEFINILIRQTQKQDAPLHSEMVE